MNRIARRAAIVIILALFLIGGFSFFIAEYVIQAERWVMFPGSPHVYSGGNIGCGVAVDRDGILLLDMNGQRTYSNDSILRQATVHWLGDRNGSVNAPALATYSTQIAGYDLLNGVYSYGKTGGVAKMTLSAKAQQTALEALGTYKGTVAVYNYKTGELLCAVTTPTFDPDQVAEVLDGMYWNRFTQSVYTPGSIFKIVTLAAALETIPDIQEQTFVCNGEYQMGADKITCEGIHFDQNIKEAFCNSCNCAFAQISQQLGGDVLMRYVEQFGITQSVSFDGITTASGSFSVDQTPVNIAWSSIGQYKDQTNPCVFLTYMGAIANGGTGVKPYIIGEIEVGIQTTYRAKTERTERIMSESTARVLKEYLRNNVETKYGDQNFPGLTVCAKTGTGEVGGDQKPNAMLAGFVENEEYPYAFIACVEDAGYGSTVCVPIISKVLEALTK